jgi:hypothetical protein
VVSFTPRPLYPQGKRPRYRLDSRLLLLLLLLKVKGKVDPILTKHHAMKTHRGSGGTSHENCAELEGLADGVCVTSVYALCELMLILNIKIDHFATYETTGRD